MSSSLTPGEKRKLNVHEATIEQGINSFVSVGKALVAIREERLYTDVDGTFEGYCKKRWGFAKSRAYQLIDAASVVEVVSTIGGHAPPNERVARELASVPGETKQADVWAKAVETAPKDKAGNAKVTAAHVRKVAVESGLRPKPAATNGHAAEPPATAPEPATPAKPAKGQPTIDLRKFSDLETHLGKAVRMNTEIKEHCGGAEYHEKIRQHLNESLKVLDTWRKHSGAA